MCVFMAEVNVGYLALCLSRRSLSLNLMLMHLAGQKHPGIPLSLLLQRIGIRAHAIVPVFYMGTMVWIQILMVVWQSTSPTEPSPCPFGLPLLLTCYLLFLISIFLSTNPNNLIVYLPGKPINMYIFFLMKEMLGTLEYFRMACMFADFVFILIFL